VVGSYPDVPPECETGFLFEVPLVAVAAASHPLAALPAPIARSEAARHVQLILTDRSSLTEGRQFGVVSQQGWRLADLGAKHAFLRAGLGWGGMPRHMVEDELARGSLVELKLEASPVLGQALSMYASWRKDAPPGPAGRRFIELLRQV
jgi:DNA-binding transcriptional LysR family regulator